MGAIDIKKVRARAAQMSAAWREGAPTVEFMGITREAFDAKSDEGAILEKEVADLEAQLKMKRDRRDTLYREQTAMIVAVGNGVRGNVNFGDDSELYGAMGFVRKSERKTGLTQKKKRVA